MICVTRFPLPYSEFKENGIITKQEPRAMQNKNRLSLLLQPNGFLIQTVLKCPQALFLRPNESRSLNNKKAHLVEYMETPFSRIPHDYTWLLQ